MEIVIILLGIAAFIGFMFFRLKSKINNFTNGKTYEDYKNDYPGFIKEGKAYCHKCNTHEIFVKQVGSTPQSILNSHICRNCGTELYRSRISA